MPCAEPRYLIMKLCVKEEKQRLRKVFVLAKFFNRFLKLHRVINIASFKYCVAYIVYDVDNTNF